MPRFLPRNPIPISSADLSALEPFHGVLAQLLYARGITTKAQAEAFLNPSPDQFHDPFSLFGIKAAVERITLARDRQTPTVVYGDYDVDGICATSLLVEALQRFGLSAKSFIPLRKEGYGLNLRAVEDLARDYRMLITVDLGITNHEEVLLAQSLGMEVIVTDHHQLSSQKSPADVLVTPLLNSYLCPNLCGTGVAFKLAQALLGQTAAMDYLDLAALATVADIVPLVGENRTIVSLGLPEITAKKREGIRALMEVSGVQGPADSYTLGFQLAPRLNAAGRLQDANQGLQLLTTKHSATADSIAKTLDQLNSQRKALEIAVLKQAEAQAQTHDFVSNPMLLVSGEGWHQGVIGLVAGRLCKKYACPTAALSQEDGLLHGSLRSVPGINIHHCLQACDDLLLRYGGHEQAAGVTLALENYNAFSQRMQVAVLAAAEKDTFLPRCEYDLPLSPDEINETLLSDLEKLAPFGCANLAPLFLLKDTQLSRRRVCGAEGAHLQITFRSDSYSLDGIAFGMGPMASRLPDEVDAVISLKWDMFRGRGTIKCEANAIQPAAQSAEKELTKADTKVFEASLMESLAHFLPNQSKAGKSRQNPEIIRSVDPCDQQSFPAPNRGVLYVARTRESALKLLQRWPGQSPDLAWFTPPDILCFPTLLLCPTPTALSGFWRKIVLLDGEIRSSEAVSWSSLFPQAEILICPNSKALENMAAAMDAGDEAYRILYRLLRAHTFSSLAQAASTAGMTSSQACTGLTAFAELHLIDYAPGPFAYTMLPPTPCRLEDSTTLSAIRNLASLKGV